jgi:hypothetical protein
VTFAGNITVDGLVVGTIDASLVGDEEFTPNLDGYEPAGRADEGLHGDHPQAAPPSPEPAPHAPHPRGRTHHDDTAPVPPPAREHHERRRPLSRDRSMVEEPSGEVHPRAVPPGRDYAPSSRGRPFNQGSEETDAAIRGAARYAGVDVNTMRSIASIESEMNPASNAYKRTKYKGLFQIGSRGPGNEWERFGEGNIYSAQDNAMATARMFRANKSQFRHHFGRDPTDAELYMMHQQGLGFYTRGAMTNISGNPYPGMHGPQTHESFEAGWGAEVARRKAMFSARRGSQEANDLAEGVAPP